MKKDRSILDSILPDDVITEDSMFVMQMMIPIVLSAYEDLRRANLSPEDSQNFILAMLGVESLSDNNKKNLKKLMKEVR